MIVDRLILHHNYDGPSAVDVSQNHNHGVLEGVHPSGGMVRFGDGGDCVRVRANPTLESLHAVRTSVRFKLQPTGTRRYNLIEGYLSFALVIDSDLSLHGTINNKTLGWIGAASAPGIVTPGMWHEATMVHDGFSAIRVDLDGVTVAESFSVRGPIIGVQAPLGLCIGHWAGDDRYTFVGDIDDVKVWKDRPDAATDFADKCCLDGESVDDMFADLRAGATHGDFDRDAYRHAGDVMMELGAKTFGSLAAGTEVDRAQAWDLVRRFVLAFGRGDTNEFANVVGTAAWRTAQKVPTAELSADARALADALRPTVLGPLVDDALGGTDPQRQRAIAEKLGLLGWLDAFCVGWAKPEPPKRGREGDGKGDGNDHSGDKDPRPKDPRSQGPDSDGSDPAVDRDPSDSPPGWGFNAGGPGDIDPTDPVNPEDATDPKRPQDPTRPQRDPRRPR